MAAGLPDDKRQQLMSGSRAALRPDPLCQTGAVLSSRPSWTAQHVALARAHLTRLGVLEDPFAEGMLRPPWAVAARLLRSWPLARRAPHPTFAYLACRTRFFDDVIQGALEEGATQVIIVGAGYDSRAWRLARAGVRFFEVDHPATQNDKRSRAPAAVHGSQYVAVDIAVDSLRDAMIAAGVLERVRTVFVVEGLTMYLAESVVLELLATLRDFAGPQSRLVVNFGVGGAGASRSDSHSAVRTVASSGRESFQFELTVEDAPNFLSLAGWAIQEMLTGPDLARRYLLGTDFPQDLNPNAFAVSATPEERKGTRPQ